MVRVVGEMRGGTAIWGSHDRRAPRNRTYYTSRNVENRSRGGARREKDRGKYQG